MQIYYLATIDADHHDTAAGCALPVLLWQGNASSRGAAAVLCVSFLLTFVSLFILPVLVVFDASVAAEY